VISISVAPVAPVASSVVKTSSIFGLNAPLRVSTANQRFEFDDDDDPFVMIPHTARRRSLSRATEGGTMGKKDETPEQRAARKAKGTSHRTASQRSARHQPPGFVASLGL
jgi:hypothetical protein